MKILICYFSGTGNTKKIVDEYVNRLGELGIETELCNIEKANAEVEMPNVQNYDLVGFAYPVWAFNAPVNVLKFAKKIKKQNGNVRAFIIKSSGEPVRMNDISSLKLNKILKKRKIQVTNEYHYVMPYNIMFRHTDEMAFRMWNGAERIIPHDIDELLSGKGKLPKKVFCGGFIAWILRIQQWGGRFNGKHYKVLGSCIKCMKCVNNCPVENISVKDGKFKFSNKCLMCMRCAFECPTDAIKIGFFEKWKVNGKYSFKQPIPQEPAEALNEVTTETALANECTEGKTPNAVSVDGKHKNYCRKAYDRYFKHIEDVCSSSQAKQTEEEQ